MIMNNIQPHEVKADTQKADRAFEDLLHVRKYAKNTDFGDGVYFSMPNDPRGHKLLAIQAAAEAKAKLIEEQFANLGAFIYGEGEEVSKKSRSQLQAIEKIHIM